MPQPTITTTYAGEFAGKYIAAALLSGSTLASEAITVKPNVKFKEVIKKVDTAGIIADATCNFTSAGTVALTERILQVKELQINLELCKTPFESDWEAAAMGYSSFDELPKNFSDFFIAQLSAQVADANETALWSGSAGAGSYDGLLAQLVAASAPSVGAIAITSGNVIEEMGKVVDALNSNVYGKPDLTLYVSQNVARAYVRALGGFVATIGANGVDNKGTTWYNGGQLSFDGINIFVANGLADNRMVLAEKSNLFFGTSLLSDHQTVQLLDMANIDGSKNCRFIMRYSAGTQVGIAADTVVYTA
jgi:hypothetical protein